MATLRECINSFEFIEKGISSQRPEWCILSKMKLFINKHKIHFISLFLIILVNIHMSGQNKRLNTESSMGRINNPSVPKYPILKTSDLLLNSI